MRFNETTNYRAPPTADQSLHAEPPGILRVRRSDAHKSLINKTYEIRQRMASRRASHRAGRTNPLPYASRNLLELSQPEITTELDQVAG